MSQPSIVLIPGSFGVPEFYQDVIQAMAEADIQLHALHLPSVGLAPNVGREGVPPNMYDDAVFIAKEITKLADDGKEVILVAHSYGGIPATECIQGLAKQERQRQGKVGGLVRIAYISALVPELGKTAMDILADIPQSTQTKLDVDVSD